MKKVLITGFQPFGKETINPSYEAVKLLPDALPDITIDKLELPTVYYKSIAELRARMETIRPDIVICVGQAGGRFAITPERVAINISDAYVPDNEKNLLTDEPIFKDGPAAYFSKLPVKSMVSAMKKAGIPAELSDTAGTYVCNHVMYGVLHLASTVVMFENIKCGFIHIPFCTEQVIEKRNCSSLTLEQIAKGLLICIETAASQGDDIKVAMGTTH